MDDRASRLTAYADMSEIRLSEMQERLVERLLIENDVRNHPTTRAFFALLRPDVSERVATFYSRAQRMAFEIALGMRWLISRWEQEQARDPKTQGPDGQEESDFYRYAHDIIRGLFADNMHGYPEVQEILGALRADLDRGIGEDLDDIMTSAATRLLDDDAYGEELLKEASGDSEAR